MSDVRMLSYYLGIKVHQHKDCFAMKQTNFATSILKKARMLDYNLCKYPMKPKLQQINEKLWTPPRTTTS